MSKYLVGPETALSPLRASFAAILLNFVLKDTSMNIIYNIKKRCKKNTNHILVGDALLTYTACQIRGMMGYKTSRILYYRRTGECPAGDVAA